VTVPSPSDERPFARTFIVVWVALAAQAYTWTFWGVLLWKSTDWEDNDISPIAVVATAMAFAAVLTAMGVATKHPRRSVQIALAVALVVAILHFAFVLASDAFPYSAYIVIDGSVVVFLAGAFAGFSRILPTRREFERPSTRNRLNPAAVAAAIVAPVGPMSVVLGRVALDQIRRAGEGGRGWAILGVVVGVVWLALMVAAYIFVSMLANIEFVW
jgi:hypothetical protein